ncbi:hypothetical protein IW147_005155 [Coemansia sp. RSA 720]|nr:hypothetical protein IW147_005155 [Coemansia sp. RSA 720]
MPKPTDTDSQAVQGDIRLDSSVKSNMYYIGGVPVHFPFVPYPSQLGMMNHMIRALTKEQNTMIESPTGSGKSLALLCATLAWRQSFVVRQRKMQENVRQIISRFCMHNTMLLRSRYETDGTTGDADPAKNPDTMETDPPEKPDKSSNNYSFVTLQAHAQALQPETVEFILETSKKQTLVGLSKDDMATLGEYKAAGKSATQHPRIFFGTRTHKQVAQLVNELRTKTPYRLRTAVLGSRAQTCTHPKAKRSESVDDACRQLRDDNNCGGYTGFRRVLGNKKLAEGGALEIWDLEDIVSVARPLVACPYYASRELAATAKLVFCPYNYILDPAVRNAAGIELEGNIVILDEAHNIENAARDAGSFEVSDLQLASLAHECSGMFDHGILREEHLVLKSLADTLAAWLQRDGAAFEYCDYETQTSVWPKPNCSVDMLLTDLALTPDYISQVKLAQAKIEDYIASLRTQGNEHSPIDPELMPRDKHVSAGALRVVEGLLRVLKHVMHGSKFVTDFRIAVVRHPNPELRTSKKRKRQSGFDAKPAFINTLSFWTMNPGVVFSEIAEQTRSIVLTSGTLSPLDSYASELQVDFASTLEANHVIAPSRFCALAVECGPSGVRLEAKYRTSDQLEFQDDVGGAIYAIAARSPDGMLVFMPSYALLNKLIARWEATGRLAEIRSHKTVFVEPQGGTKDQFDKLLLSYRKHLSQRGQLGAVMFGVFRGKVSEGIDFSDHFCRTVVNIGIPFPAFKDVKVMLKREYNNEHTMLLNGSRWYDIQAFRAVNQALGRCLRHKDDWGAIIMLEARFVQNANIARLSKWVRGHMRVFGRFNDAKQYLDAFYDERISEDAKDMPQVLDAEENVTIVLDE